MANGKETTKGNGVDTLNSNTTTELHDGSFQPVPQSPNEKQNLAFARAVLVFRDELDHVRSKRSKLGTEAENCLESATSLDNSIPTEKYNRRIRILRAIQHGLTSVVSIIIAVLQSLTYAKYQHTKDIPGAWPQHPTLAPTILLMAVAIMALMFDACSLVAYFMSGNRIADVAFRLAMKLHYWITAVKTLSYVVAASVCRAGFSMGGNQDLWGWSCSKKGAQMETVNDAKFNCTGNTVAWVLSLINIAIEVIGVVVTLLVMKRDGKDYQEVPTSPNVENSKTMDENSASNQLVARNSLLDSRGDDVHGQLEQLNPNSNS